MYLRITSRCNLSCQHCCYSCRPGVGKHMDMHVLNAAFDLCHNYGDESLSLGGGEPTLHPRFFDVLRQAMQKFDYVWMATNGTRRRAMLRLAGIINDEDYEYDYDNPISPQREAHLSVELSTDYFHDRSKVDSRVWDIWHRAADLRRPGFGLRDVTRSREGVIAAGRAKRTGNYKTEKGCACSDIVIEPDGTLKGCGCRNAPVLGTVFNPQIPESWQVGECSNEAENRKAVTK